MLSRQASIASRSDAELEPSEYRTLPAVSRWISNQKGVGEAHTSRGISGGSLVGVGRSSSRWTPLFGTNVSRTDESFAFSFRRGVKGDASSREAVR